MYHHRVEVFRRRPQDSDAEVGGDSKKLVDLGVSGRTVVAHDRRAAR